VTGFFYHDEIALQARVDQDKLRLTDSVAQLKRDEAGFLSGAITVKSLRHVAACMALACYRRFQRVVVAFFGANGTICADFQGENTVI
jgi:hypothetical protein